LLEAPMPFERIPSEPYSLDSRLRQIQSSADRVLAQMRTGAPRPPMLMALRQLQADGSRLRHIPAAGRTSAPVPIAHLLAGDTARVGPVRATATPDNQAPARRPLGAPIPADTI